MTTLTRSGDDKAVSDQLIADYLHDLRTSAWIRQLPPPEATALEHEAGARIESELSAAGNRDEQTVYGVLDRLGPASEFVARHADAPSSGAQAIVNTSAPPLRRAQNVLRARGWGAAEIGALLLLIIGPFLLWWIGPIFGIILVRAVSNRWSERAEHVATLIVFGLFTAQAVMAIALFAFTLISGGSAAAQLQQLFSMLGPGHSTGAGLSPGNAAGASGTVALLALASVLSAPVAGVSSGVYLALSRRRRR